MWYLKKTWLDQESGINDVVIHYTFTPLQGPDWRQPHEVRRMEKNAAKFNAEKIRQEDVVRVGGGPVDEAE